MVSDLNLLNEASQTLCDNNMLFCVSNEERNCSTERDAKFTVQIIAQTIKITFKVPLVELDICKTYVHAIY